MEVLNNSHLYDEKTAVAFYEDRYKKGYMDEWPAEKKKRVFEVIQELQLPAQGEALDFGCGNGVFSELIRQALPGWKIYGTDISDKAIENASVRYPECTFFKANDLDNSERKFDFIFSNHVIEHVFNLSDVFNQMIKHLKPKSSMLHFLPCGNEGSYEHDVCLLRKDGINTTIENRFFFEDEGHVRRLTTDELSKLCETKNFKLAREFYCNQHYGAINWITNTNLKFIRMFTDASMAINKKAGQKLKKIRLKLILMYLLRQPAQIVTRLISKNNKHFKHYLVLLLALPFYIFSFPVDKYWKRKAREEWKGMRSWKNGSEMCLYFKRN